MAGPNFVLDKGFYVKSDQTGIKFGIAVSIDAASTGDRVVKSVASTAASATRVIGIIQEDIDDAKVATGKVAANIRLLGISRCLTGAAVVIGDDVKSDAAGKTIPAGGVGFFSHGIALTAATATDQYIDVLMTPGAVSVT